MYQKHILDLLRGSAELRYSELQPEGVESSHFKYHLDQLIQDGLVARVERGVYTLTEKGKAAVDRLSVGRINPEQTPKVITYTLLRNDEYYYLYRKDKEPFLQTLNMISGKVHLDERTHDAAIREVQEKVSLNSNDLERKVIAEVRVHQNDQLISHFIAYVFIGWFDGESPKLEKIAALDLSSRADLAPDLVELIKAIDSGVSSLDLDLTL